MKPSNDMLKAATTVAIGVSFSESRSLRSIDGAGQQKLIGATFATLIQAYSAHTACHRAWGSHVRSAGSLRPAYFRLPDTRESAESAVRTPCTRVGAEGLEPPTCWL